MATYWEKLKDPRWQKKRLEIFERDGWKCSCCWDEEKTLSVHHGYYERGLDPWEYDSDTLVSVCEECHDLLGKLTAEAHKAIAKLQNQFSIEAVGEIASAMREMSGKSEGEKRRLAERCVGLLSFGTFCDEPWRWIPGPPERDISVCAWTLDSDIALSMGAGA